MDAPDPSRLRISDDERHAVAEVLRRAAGEGRLDLEELDERLEATYAAKVYGDLPPILADLPEGAPGVPALVAEAQPAERAARPASPAYGGSRYDTSIAVMSGQTRAGVWQIGATHSAIAVMGGVDLDLRQVVFTERETVITAFALMGGVDIVVNANTVVVVDGVGIMGDFSQSRDRVDPVLDADSPVVRVRGVALMGGVSVVRKPPPGERRKRLG